MKEVFQEGFTPFRSTRSLGPADVIAVNEKIVRFIQVKRSAKDWIVSKYGKDIKRLLRMMAPPNSTKELWVGKPYKQFVKIDLNTDERCKRYKDIVEEEKRLKKALANEAEVGLEKQS